ncbi:MAG: phosphate ABC transporter substrate-binding protein [Spirochaetes bacterium]|nr:phosphate ABC transporter substrate-binding protein [Spirochaetota bacterium]
MRTKILIRTFFIIIVLIVMISGCGRRKQSITVAGSTAFQPFAEKLADQYMQIYPDAYITIQGGGSAVGIQSALSGAAQIGMADLVTLPEEAKALCSVIVARDGIAVIVNLKNQVNNLTSSQIREIYNGKIDNWKDVGGKDHPITVISREEGSGTRSSFESIIKNVSLTNNAIIQDSNGTVRETVVNDINTIGYISHGLVNDKIKPVLVNGIASTEEEIIKGRYALVRPIFFLTKETPKEKIKDFIDYILSKPGQETIKQNGLIPAK